MAARPQHDHNMRTAAKATITRTAFAGVGGVVVGENTGIGRDKLARKNLGGSHQQNQKRDHAPGCGPLRH